jgi:hypothetical protein
MGATPDDKWLLGGTYMRCPDVASGTCVVHAVSVPGGLSQQIEQARFIASRVADQDPDTWRHIADVARGMVQGSVS